MKFRVDYVTNHDERGVWHNEVDAKDITEVEQFCRKEFPYIAHTLSRLRAHTLSRLRPSMGLKELVVVEIVETDLSRVNADGCTRTSRGNYINAAGTVEVVGRIPSICRCDNQMIKCDAHGCRCIACGGLGAV